MSRASEVLDKLGKADEALEKGRFWHVSISALSLDPDYKFNRREKAEKSFKGLLESLNVKYIEITSVGYTDMTVVLKSKSEADAVNLAKDLADKVRDTTPTTESNEYGVSSIFTDYIDEENMGQPDNMQEFR